MGSQPRRSFSIVFFSPIGRTTAVVVPTGLTQTYGFEKQNEGIVPLYDKD
jgi:hypothetical protein